MTSPVLLVVAHPALERARTAPALLRAAERAFGVEVHDLYEAYPDFLIDVEAEQRRLEGRRTLALQFPFFWYSVPALMKEWIDLVFSHGFAYGRGGTALAGVTLICGFSTGGGGEAYGAAGGNRFSIAEFLRPLEATAHLCGMTWAEPYVVHGAAVLDDSALAAAGAGWAERLTRLAAEGG